jgi:hypothetical protein
MITLNVYHRVFFIKGDDYGTAFAIDHEGRQYLVTARHLFADPASTASIRLFFDRKWLEVPVDHIGSGRGEVDISVFATKNLRLSPDLPLEPTLKDIVIAQDVYFVGYPYKMWTDAGSTMAKLPFPFVKKGTLSSAFDSGDGVNRIYIDALNNEGFSGGPVVFMPNKRRDFCVGGVVSKFRIEFERVIDKEGNDSGHTVAYNTGFLIAYPIQYAIDLITANPIGLDLARFA